MQYIRETNSNFEPQLYNTDTGQCAYESQLQTGGTMKTLQLATISRSGFPKTVGGAKQKGAKQKGAKKRNTKKRNTKKGAKQKGAKQKGARKRNTKKRKGTKRGKNCRRR
jgi:hypothetical protein